MGHVRYARCVTRASTGEMDRRLGHACLPSPAQTPGSPAPLQPSDLLAPEGDRLPVPFVRVWCQPPSLFAEGRLGLQSGEADTCRPGTSLGAWPGAIPTPRSRGALSCLVWSLRLDTVLPSQRTAPLGPGLTGPQHPRAPSTSAMSPGLPGGIGFERPAVSACRRETKSPSRR